jgi:hypothetical protein
VLRASVEEPDDTCTPTLPNVLIMGFGMVPANGNLGYRSDGGSCGEVGLSGLLFPHELGRAMSVHKTIFM